MERDPVCNMELPERDPQRAKQHGGQIYYFCSATCRRRFEADPERYARPLAEAGAARHSPSQTRRNDPVLGVHTGGRQDVNAPLGVRTGQNRPARS